MTCRYRYSDIYGQRVYRSSDKCGQRIYRFSDICGQRCHRSIFATTLSDLRTTLSADKTLKPYFNRIKDGVALRSNYLDAQANLELWCMHLYEYIFSRSTV